MHCQVKPPHNVKKSPPLNVKSHTQPSGVFFSRHTEIVDLAARMQLPGMFPEREFAEAGGLMMYGPSIPAIFRRAATYVDKILKGAKPAELPGEQPLKFELVINLNTA